MSSPSTKSNSGRTQTSLRTARAPHKCNACSNTIEPGEPYKRIAVLYEGTVTTHNYHPMCAAEDYLLHTSNFLVQHEPND